MKKITLINAYGHKNLGDSTILTVALGLINKAFNNECEISLLCEHPKDYAKIADVKGNIKSYELPYGFAIRSENQAKVSYLIKLVRLIQICLFTLILILIGKIFPRILPSSGFYSYITAIKNADLVVGMGGGYFIASHPIKDYFGLILTILPVYVAKFYEKRIISFPISFGPFAAKLQEKLTFWAIKNTTVMVREKISLDLISKLDTAGKVRTLLIPDLALYFKNKIHIKQNKRNKYIVLTALEWFDDLKRQQEFEKMLIDFVREAWSKYKLKTVFIAMAWNNIEDDDNRVANRIKLNIQNDNIFSVFHPKSLSELQKKLGQATIAVCTRMHSAILSTTVFTPFITIGYGHKTLGFVKSYDIEKWYIDINEVNFEKLMKKFDDLLIEKEYNMLISKLRIKQEEISKYLPTIISTLQ